MIKKSYNYLFLLFTVFSLNAFSQTKSNKDSSTVIIFNSGSNNVSKKYNENNIIKLAPLSFISGRFPLTYERKITDFLSLQLGVGLTSRNYVRTALNNEIVFEDDGESSVKQTSTTLPDNVMDATDKLYNFDNRKATLGYMVSLQPRIYFESEALEGTFMGVSFEMYKYNFAIPGFVDKGSGYVHKGDEKKEFENINDFNVIFGRQYLYDRITFELFTGIGLRSVKGEKYVAGVDNNVLYEGVSKYSQKTIVFSGGLKVGYLF